MPAVTQAAHLNSHSGKKEYYTIPAIKCVSYDLGQETSSVCFLPFKDDHSAYLRDFLQG